MSQPRAHTPFLNVRVDEPSRTATIEVEGVIGMPEWWGGPEDADRTTTKEKMRADLKALSALDGVDTIRVLINSYGGDVNHALSIYDLLVQHPATVETVVGGMSASAATIIAQAGSPGKRYISENAFYLVHRSWGGTLGTVTDLRAYADSLEKLDGRIAAIYAGASGRSAEEHLAEMRLANEQGVWLTAEEAVAQGYADAVKPAEGLPAAAMKRFGREALRAAGLKAPSGYDDESNALTRLESLVQRFTAAVQAALPGAQRAGFSGQPRTTMTQDTHAALLGALNLTQIEVDSEQGVYLNTAQLNALNAALAGSAREAEEARQQLATAQGNAATAEQALTALQTAQAEALAALEIEAGEGVEPVKALSAEITRLREATPGAQGSRIDDPKNDPQPPAPVAAWESDDAWYNKGLHDDLKITAKPASA